MVWAYRKAKLLRSSVEKPNIYPENLSRPLLRMVNSKQKKISALELTNLFAIQTLEHGNDATVKIR